MKNMKKVLASVLLVCMVCSMMVMPAAADTVGGTEVTLNRYGLPLMVGEVYDLTATVAPEVTGNTNLVWSSSDEAVAAVDANGVVTAMAVGSAKVTAATADGSYSAACDVLVAESIVHTESISLDYAEFSMDMGGSASLSATVYPENASLKSVVWLSSDENVVSVDENGNVYALAAGSAVVSAWAAELDLSAAPLNEALIAKCQINVVDRAAEEAARLAAEQAAAEEAARIAAEEEAARIAAEQAAAEEAARIAAEEEAARIAAEQAAAEEAARIAAEQAAAEEAARIAAEQAAAEEAARIAAEQAAAENTIVLPTVGVSAVDTPMYLSGSALPNIVTNFSAMEMSTLELGDTYDLSAHLSDSSMPPVGYTWESSDPNVVSVAVTGDSAYCTLTVVGAGNASVTVSRGEYANAATIGVVVYNDVVTVTDSRSTMLTGESHNFAAEGKWGSKAVTWTSSNPAVATVDANGLVYAAGVGEAVITATSANDRAAAPASAGVTVTVSAPPPTVINVTGVSLDKGELALITGGSYDLTASVAPTDASNKNVTWTSSDPTVASVDANGVVTALKAGTAAITVTTVDGGFTAGCAVSVSDPAPTVVPVTGVSFDKNSVSLIPGGSATIIATVSPAEASNKALTWASTDSSIASVSDGVVIAHKAGAVTVTATAQDGSGCYAACTVTVSDISVALDKSSFQLALGSVEAFVLKATVSPDTAPNKTVTWSSSDPTVATVDQTGKVIAVGAGTTVVTATTVDGGKTASCTVSVKAKPAVDIQCAYENPSFLSNEGTYSGITAVIKDNALPASNFLWSSSDESVVSVTGSGTNNATCIVTIKGKVGSAVITASHAGCDADTISINVVAPTNVPVTGITITGSGNSTTVGGTLQLGAVVTPDNASNKAVTWSSSNTAVATVDQTGKVTGTGVGTANITATAQDGSGKSYTVAINVAAAPNGILYVSSNVNTISTPGGTALLTARLANNSIVPNASISWTVSPADMASVSVNGVVTPKRAGSFTITGTFAAGGVNYTGSTTIRMAPVIIYGNNSSYNGSNTPLYFVTNDLSSNARGVRVDGYTLTHGQHCYIYDHQGYIAVALNPAYLRTLSPSVVHTIQIDSANGTSTGYFRIYGYSSAINGVQTGDENQAALWAALFAVSVMGMGAVLISRRKEWNS